jgi:hypothetical protein
MTKEEKEKLDRLHKLAIEIAPELPTDKSCELMLLIGYAIGLAYKWDIEPSRAIVGSFNGADWTTESLGTVVKL